MQTFEKNASFNCEALTTAELQRNKKRLEMELAYRSHAADNSRNDISFEDPFDDSWFDDDEEFDAANDNDHLNFMVEFKFSGAVGKVQAEIECLHLFEVLQQMKGKRIDDFSIDYGICGSPRVTIEFEDYDGWVHEGTVTFHTE